MKRVLSKILLVLLVMSVLLNYSSSVFAAFEISMDKRLIEPLGKADNHLKYYRENLGEYTYHTTTLLGYKGEDGKVYPVYCINKDLPGAEKGEYYVTTKNMLNNDKIWRIIKNGYPFKNASYWGLNDEKDVYVITRFAIYCVLGQDRLDYFKVEDDDKEGVAMLSALKKLVNIGEKGTEKQLENPIYAERKGVFKEKGNFFAQEYKIKSNAEFNKYTVDKVSGLPEGGYIANSEGLEKKEFLESESLYVMIPKTQMIKKLNINIKIKAQCKSYLVLEGKTTIEGKQNYAVTVGENSIFTTNINLNEEVNTAGLVVFKTDSENRKAISGVEFELLDEKGYVVDKGITNGEGKIEFKNLVQGKYTIKETKSNEKYIEKKENIEVDIEYNEIKTIGITNEHKKRKFKNI